MRRPQAQSFILLHLPATSLPPVGIGTLCHRALQAEGAEVVIALTHMRLPNDLRLAEGVPGIDLVLGGVRPLCCAVLCCAVLSWAAPCQCQRAMLQGEPLPVAPAFSAVGMLRRLMPLLLRHFVW